MAVKPGGNRSVSDTFVASAAPLLSTTIRNVTVSLTDSLPAGISFTGSTESQGTYNQATGLWTIGTLADGATATLTLSGTVNVGQGGNTIINTTTAATADQPDPTTAGDDLNELVVVNDAADLVTVKTLASSNTTPAEGDTVSFQIVVTNNGGAQATNVSLTDALPTGITFTNSSTTQGSYNANSGVFDIGTLNVGDTATLTLEGTVDAGESGNTITNIATAATGDQTDPTPAGDDLNEAVVISVLADKDGDGVGDSLDADADGDGILDENETTVAIDSGSDGAISAANLTFGITSNSPTTASEAHFLDSITISGVNSTIDGVYTDLIVPDGYSPAFSTNDPSDVDVLENGATTEGINDPGFEAAALAAFQDRNLQHFQRLDGHDYSSDSYTLTYDTPVLSSAGGFIAFTERGGNNPQQAEAFDIDGNSLGTIDLTLADYADTGHKANNNQNIELAIFAIDDLAPVGSEIASIQVSLAGSSNDGPDGKVFLYGAVQSFSTGIDTDQDGIDDHCDLDADNDGISDLMESGNALAIAADTNLDGLIDNNEATAANFTDTNNDGAWDQLGNNTPLDTDGDGVFDYLDLDSDDDGIPDAVEAQPTGGYQSPEIGSDADNDGVLDTFDDPSVVTGGAFTAPEDTDGDNTPDYLDEDSDDDGALDSAESGLGTVTDATFQDTDGSVSNTSTDLDNEFGDQSEVGFREANAAPMAVDQTVIGVAGEATTITLLANDSDPDGDPLTITEINGATLTGNAQMIAVPNGTVDVAADGTITVTPDAGFNGDVDVPYTIDDQKGGTDSAVHTVVSAVLSDKDGDNVADVDDLDDDNDGILDTVESPTVVGEITTGDGTTTVAGVFENDLGTSSAFEIVSGDPAIDIFESPGGVTEGLQVRWDQETSIDFDLDLTLQQPAGGILESVRVGCLLYTSPSPRDATLSRMPSSA